MQNVLSLKLTKNHIMCFSVRQLLCLLIGSARQSQIVLLNRFFWFSNYSARQLHCLTESAFLPLFVSVRQWKLSYWHLTLSASLESRQDNLNCLTETVTCVCLTAMYIYRCKTIVQDNSYCLARYFIFYTEHIHTRSHTYIHAFELGFQVYT